MPSTPIIVRDLPELLADYRPKTGFDLEGVVRVASGVDRLAYAFAVAYDAALHQLVPDAPGLCALAATENKSAHPRDILTTVNVGADGSGTVSGAKSFVTMGSLAETLLVVARTGTPRDDLRPDLKLVMVPADAPGVFREELPKTPFAPELPHAKVRFQDAPGTVLPGDGYARYMKPFRTVEDVWVHLALVAWLSGMAARDGWGDAFLADAAALLADARALVAADPTSLETHLALGEHIARARALVARAAFSESRAAEKALFERDTPLLWVAERARIERLSRVKGGGSG